MEYDAAELDVLLLEDVWVGVAEIKLDMVDDVELKNVEELDIGVFVEDTVGVVEAAALEIVLGNNEDAGEEGDEDEPLVEAIVEENDVPAAEEEGEDEAKELLKTVVDEVEIPEDEGEDELELELGKAVEEVKMLKDEDEDVGETLFGLEVVGIAKLLFEEEELLNKELLELLVLLLGENEQEVRGQLLAPPGKRGACTHSHGLSYGLRWCIYGHCRCADNLGRS